MNFTEQNSNIPFLSNTEVKAFVQDMSKSFFNQLIREGIDLMEESTYTERSDILKKIRQRFINSRGFQKIPDYEKVYSLLEAEFKDYLETMKIEFDENNEFYILEESRNNRDYVDDKFQLDVKKTSPFAIRFLLSSLAKTKGYNAVTGEIEFDTDGAVLGLRQLIPFNRVFVTMLESIVHSTSFEDAIKKIETLGRRNNDFKALLNILGANKGTFDLSNLKEHQWRLLIILYRTFNLQRPEVLILKSKEEQIYFYDPYFGSIKKLKYLWDRQIALKINSGTSKFFKKNKNGEFAYVPKSVDAFGITVSEKISFLNELGININIEDFKKLSAKERSVVLNAANAIKTYIPKAPPFKIAKAKYLEVSGQISKIAEAISKNQRVLSETTFVNPDGKQQQAFVQPNYFSTITNIFNSVLTLDELFEKLPHLKYDEFSKNSLILKKDGRYFDKSGNRKKLKLTVGYIGGHEKDEKGRKLDNLTGPDRLMAQINGVLEEKHYISVPADSSTEWNINLLNFISDSQAISSEFESYFLEIFKGYLQDEIDLISDKSRAKNDNVGSKWKNLRFFRTILSPETVSKIEKTKEIPKEVDHEIIEWFYGITSKLRDTLEYNSQLQQINENLFTIPGLLSEYTRDSKTFSERELQGFLNYVSANAAIANMEFHKVFFGDPYNFQIKKDGTLDETKRIKSFGSPAIPLFTNKFYNIFFNKVYNAEVKKWDFGYFSVDDYVTSTTFKFENISQFFKIHFDTGENISSFHTIFCFREILNRLGEWGVGQKNWFETEVAYARLQLYNKGRITAFEYPLTLKLNDEMLVKRFKKLANIPVIKLIIRGQKVNEEFNDIILDDTYSVPLLFSVVEGTIYEDIFVKLYRENIDYVCCESARSSGAEGVNELEISKGLLNEKFCGVFKIKWDTFNVCSIKNIPPGL